jgi:FkbM family methyltransferase
VSLQTLLLRIFSSGILHGQGQRLLDRRIWRVEGGEGAGLRMALPQNREYILGTSEMPVQRALSTHLRHGDVFYDIGANVGFFSLLAARMVGTSGAVCSFEPVTENASMVRKNATLNDFGNIRVVEVAVGSEPGVAEFLLTEWDGGGTLALSAVRTTERVSSRMVPVATLDDLIFDRRLPRPTFVKIDVEGVELDVLKGMSRTLKESMPILLFEVDDGSKDSLERRWRQLDDHVSACGYHVTHLPDSYPNNAWYVGHTLAMPPYPRGGAERGQRIRTVL